MDDGKIETIKAKAVENGNVLFTYTLKQGDKEVETRKVTLLPEEVQQVRTYLEVCFAWQTWILSSAVEQYSNTKKPNRPHCRYCSTGGNLVYGAALEDSNSACFDELNNTFIWSPLNMNGTVL